MSHRAEAVDAFETALRLRLDFPEVRAEIAALRQLQAAVDAAVRNRASRP